MRNERDDGIHLVLLRPRYLGHRHHAHREMTQPLWPLLQSDLSTIGIKCHGPPGSFRLFLVHYTPANSRRGLFRKTTSKRIHVRVKVTCIVTVRGVKFLKGTEIIGRLNGRLKTPIKREVLLYIFCGPITRRARTWSH